MNQAQHRYRSEEMADPGARTWPDTDTRGLETDADSLASLPDNIRCYLDAWARHVSASNGFGDLAG